MYPCNLSAPPIKTNGAFPLLCCDKIEHNEWHLESAKLQAASRSYHVLLLQCHLLTFFTKQNVYLICSFLRMHLLKSRSPGGGDPIYIYIFIYIYTYYSCVFFRRSRLVNDSNSAPPAVLGWRAMDFAGGWQRGRDWRRYESRDLRIQNHVCSLFDPDI